MPSNSAYLSSTPGILKMISIVLVIPVVAVSFYAFLGSEYFSKRDDHKIHLIGEEVSLWREYLLPIFSALLLVGSVISLIIHISSVNIYWNVKTAYVDFLHHALGGVALMGSGAMFVIGAVKLYDINCKNEFGCQLWEYKLGAGFFGMMAGLVYAVIGVVVLTNRKDVERDPLMEFEDDKPL